MKKAVIITAVIFIIIGLAVFAAAFAAAGFDFSKLGTVDYETNTYTADGVFQSIEISTLTSDITLKPSEDGKCSVVCEERAKVKHDVRVEDGVLKISAVDQRKWYDYIGFFTRNLSMTVYLPADQYDELTVDCHTGDVSIPEEFSFGSVDVKASTGNILCLASASGYVRLKASTGDIRVEGISAEEIELSVSTGDINARSITCAGSFGANVTTGKATLTDISCRTAASEGGTGDAVLKNVVASDTLSVKRGTGDVRLDNCDAGEITIKTSTGDVKGTLRTEKVFIAKTTTGSVRVPDTITGGRCEITTSTGDIRIEYAAN